MDIQKITAIGADIATIITLAFVAYQAAMFKKDYKTRNDILEREKAIELSKFYAEKIISNLTYINYVFSSEEISKCFANLKYNQLKEFDKYELETLLDNKKISKIQEKLDKISLNSLINASIYLPSTCIDELNESKNILALYEIYCSPSNEEIAATQNINTSNFEEGSLNIKMKHSTLKLKYKKQFNDILNETLNLLEYFCMNFNSGIADEATVYQSLHQSFLGSIKALYFTIANRNISGKDKYYTNIIDLFNKWSSRYSEQCDKELDGKRKTTHKKEKIKK